ncbi:MAG: phospho-sugar mutase [Tissierellia bacterium]|nr:phospho-sugar mutase [Tissierellia bacterium]
MNYNEKYQQWLNNPFFDEATRKELKAIEGDQAEIQDRFYKDLEFGTAGLRGKLGAGSNRMNIYTVSLASQGLAETIKTHGQEAMERGVVISRDVRHMSKEFAEITARVLAANGIKVYLHKDITPTPVLSYSIRKLKTISGVMITASHNPKQYNGYKAYWEEGSQILEDIADDILDKMEKVGDYSNVKMMDFDKALEEGLIEWIDESLIDQYINDVLSLTIEDDKIDKNVSIVYSPLNGTGNKLVRRILEERGFTNVHIVEEQENPDPDFTTVGYPNPEDPKAFEYAIRLGKEVNADILLATDPDADRTALEVKNDKGDYVFLNGNKIGALLANYILSRLHANDKLPSDGAIVKSIVTGDLSKVIAKDYGVECLDVLTGFKNIFAPANVWDKTHEKTFIYGFEESIGYNYGTFVRDKDAVSSAMMISEMTAFYKKQGKSLLDVLDDLYDKYGYYGDKLISIVLEGADGQALISRIMEDYRKEPISEIGDLKLEKTIDYKFDETGLPKSNVLKYIYDDGSWFVVRPSGTEPKIKLYIYSVAENEEEGDKKIQEIFDIAHNKIQAVE